jgi:hypothetical protein
MKTNHKKVPSNTWRVNKVGHTPFTIKKIVDMFKFNRPLQDQVIKSHVTVGFTRFEKEEALKTEAEARRNQGQVYANITPIR